MWKACSTQLPRLSDTNLFLFSTAWLIARFDFVPHAPRKVVEVEVGFWYPERGMPPASIKNSCCGAESRKSQILLNTPPARYFVDLGRYNFLDKPSPTRLQPDDTRFLVLAHAARRLQVASFSGPVPAPTSPNPLAPGMRPSFVDNAWALATISSNAPILTHHRERTATYLQTFVIQPVITFLKSLVQMFVLEIPLIKSFGVNTTTSNMTGLRLGKGLGVYRDGRQSKEGSVPGRGLVQRWTSCLFRTVQLTPHRNLLILCDIHPAAPPHPANIGKSLHCISEGVRQRATACQVAAHLVSRWPQTANKSVSGLKLF